MSRRGIQFKIHGVKEVHSLDEWSALTSSHSNQKRSAYLTGKSWFATYGTFPGSVASALQKSGINPTDFHLHFAVAEHLTPLDTFVAPSRTDLMVYCQVNREKAVFAMEGKVDEAFGDEICRWIRDARKTDPSFLRLPINSRKKARLEFLNRLLDLNEGTESVLHYQLFHRTACALLEARSVGASKAFMVVQSFSNCQDNWSAYQAFAIAMGFSHTVEDSFTEVKYLTKFSGIGLRLGWVYDTTS